MPEYTENKSKDHSKKEETIYRPSESTPSVNTQTSEPIQTSSEVQSSTKPKEVTPGPVDIDNTSESRPVDLSKTNTVKSTSDSSLSKNSRGSKAPSDQKIGEVNDEFTEELSGNISQNRGARPIVREKNSQSDKFSENPSDTPIRNDRTSHEKKHRSPRKSSSRRELEPSASRSARTPYNNRGSHNNHSETHPRNNEKNRGKSYSKNKTRTPAIKKASKKVGFFKRVLIFLGFDFRQGSQANKKTDRSTAPESIRRKSRHTSGKPQSRRAYKGKFGEGRNNKPRRNRRRPKHEGSQRTINH